jgi:hypothetical protein
MGILARAHGRDARDTSFMGRMPMPLKLRLKLETRNRNRWELLATCQIWDLD